MVVYFPWRLIEDKKTSEIASKEIIDALGIVHNCSLNSLPVNYNFAPKARIILAR
jgi:hypothetical protein